MLANDYTAPFQLGHPGAFALADRLAALLPEPFNHVFFVNSGSEAIDTALKMAMAYHRARGESQRLRFVSRERAYHGVNMGGISLAGMVRNRETFPVVIPNVVMLRHTWDEAQAFTRGQPERGAELADDLVRFCDSYGGATIAAVFVEPVAGSTGVLVPPKGYLERLRAICDRHGILLVFDEVITGFGRLGAPFAAQAFGVTPDIMTMAKALTNGAIPMGAVAARDEIYETIAGAAPESAIEFFHGYTYSGHPAACAAGLATLDIYEGEGLFERAAELSPYFLDAIWSPARPAAGPRHPRLRPDRRRRGAPRAPAGPARAAPSCRSGCSGTAATSSGPAISRSSPRPSSRERARSTRSSTACAARSPRRPDELRTDGETPAPAADRSPGCR